MGILYIVPTPVGNIEDMTLRAVRILREADLVLAEDTRTSGLLMKHFNIQNRLMSHHKFNEHGTAAAIVERLQAGQNIALVSDAGTPGISDPGFYLTREASRAGITVQCLPGATACIPAVVASGLPCDRFCFEGFLPQKKGRRSHLEALEKEPHDDLLRIALSSAQDIATICRNIRQRQTSERGARNIESARRASTRHAARGDTTFHSNRATRRNRYRAGRKRNKKRERTKNE